MREALELVRPARPRRARAKATDGPARTRGTRRRLPDLAHLTDDPGVYVVRNASGQVVYVGKSVSVRARARAHFQPSAHEGAWVEQAETVEHERTNSELGALLLESRLIKRLRPPGNARLKHVDRYVYLRCRLDIAFPVLEVAPAPAAGRGVSVGPLRGRAAAVELLEQLNSLFGLRHCARKLPRRYWPSAYGQMGRCLSPCLGDLDPNLYRRRLDEALALFTGEGDGGAALLAHLDAQMRAAAAEQNFERAAWLRRRRERLAWLLERLGGVAGRHARAAAARAGRAPARRALRRVLARGRARRRLGAAGRPRRGRWRAPCARCAAATGPARPRAWRPTRSTRRASSPRGSMPTKRRRSTSTAAPTAPPSRACWRQRTTTVMPMPGECSVQTIR